MDKDELSELLISEDKELRKLGISLLISNFNLPEKLYYIFNKDGEYYLDLYPQKDLFSFSLNIMKNINKDKLVEMIRSSDFEIKELGMSLLLDNFDFPEKLYYDKDSNGYYTYSWKFSSTNVNFLNKEAYLQYLNIFHGRINDSILYAIFKYNEDNRKG